MSIRSFLCRPSRMYVIAKNNIRRMKRTFMCRPKTRLKVILNKKK